MNSGCIPHVLLKELRISIEHPKLSYPDIIANFASADLRVLSLHGIHNKEDILSTSIVLQIVARYFSGLKELVLVGSHVYDCNYVRFTPWTGTSPDHLRYRFH